MTSIRYACLRGTTRLVLTALGLGIGLSATIGCSDGSYTGGQNPVSPELPPMDLRAPATLETASFALG